MNDEVEQKPLGIADVQESILKAITAICDSIISGDGVLNDHTEANEVWLLAQALDKLRYAVDG